MTTGARVRDRRRGSARALLAVSAIALAVGTAGCGSGDRGPAMLSPGDAIRMVVEARGADQYVSLIVAEVCLSRQGSVELVGVEPVETVGGFEVTDFVMVSWKDDDDVIPGYENRRLDRVPRYAAGNRTLKHVCDSGRGGPAHIVVEAHKPGVESASAQGFIATYRSGGELRKVRIDWAQKLCNKPLDHPECEF